MSSSESHSDEESEFSLGEENQNQTKKQPLRRSKRTTRASNKRTREDDSSDEDEAPRKKKAVQEEKDDEDDEAPFGLNYSCEGTVYVITSDQLKASEKVASFDMDDTLLKTASGRKFPTGRNDWQWWDPSVPKKLKSLHEDGYKIVIFTNQQGVEKGKVKVTDVIFKIYDLCQELGFPMQAFIAISGDNFRKPGPDLWYMFIDNYNDGIEAEKNENTFYCGDAGGRPAGVTKSKKKDFSCSDRKFALNVPVKFYTPETLFLEWDDQEFNLGFDPVEFLKTTETITYDENDIISQSQEIVVSVGFPASGKSTFAKKYFEKNNYVVVNRDTLKTQKKCEQVANAALDEGKSVIIDNTNPAVKTRATYVKMAKERKIPIRCFHFKTPLELAEHLNAVRSVSEGTKKVPPIGYNMFKKNYEKPTLDEGFSEVRVIKWSPDFEGKDDHLAHFNHYT